MTPVPRYHVRFMFSVSRLFCMSSHSHLSISSLSGVNPLTVNHNWVLYISALICGGRGRGVRGLRQSQHFIRIVYGGIPVPVYVFHGVRPDVIVHFAVPFTGESHATSLTGRFDVEAHLILFRSGVSVTHNSGASRHVAFPSLLAIILVLDLLS
jgi:hypothetical protein